MRLADSVGQPKIVNRPISELGEVLRYVMMKMGLRGANLPSDMETQVLVQHITDNYAGHSCEEIKLAFDMAINGKIGDTDDFANCYENFSCAFFSKIMGAYRKWAATEVKYLPKNEHKTEVKNNESKPEITDWTDVYNIFYKMDDIDPKVIPTELFDWLFYTGKIRLTGKEKDSWYWKAAEEKRKWLFEEITRKSTPEKIAYLKEFNRQVAENDFQPDVILVIKGVAKKMFLVDYIKKEKASK